jgi:hypothetical protein
MMDRLRYDEEDGTLEIEGTYTPKGARVVMHSDGLIAAKIPGYHFYGGQGRSQNYAPAEFVIYEQIYSDQQRDVLELTRPGGIEADGWIAVRKRISFAVRS